MLEIVIATGNRHKFRELTRLLRVRGIHWRSLVECAPLPRVIENGRTFDANAVRKARAVAKATGHLTLADDSGLEVDALEGAPGVRSARFAGRHGNDQANTERLLQVLTGVPTRQRGAQYQCSLALASPSGLVALTRGTWRGRIAFFPKGHRGFGYDPVFLVPHLGRTVSEVPGAVKQRLSHRARAARKLQRVLKRLVVLSERRRGGSGLGRPGREPVA